MEAFKNKPDKKEIKVSATTKKKRSKHDMAEPKAKKKIKDTTIKDTNLVEVAALAGALVPQAETPAVRTPVRKHAQLKETRPQAQEQLVGTATRAPRTDALANAGGGTRAAQTEAYKQNNQQQQRKTFKITQYQIKRNYEPIQQTRALHARRKEPHQRALHGKPDQAATVPQKPLHTNSANQNRRG